MNQADAHISLSTRWVSTVGLSCSEQNFYRWIWYMLARGALLLCHFDINSVNAPDLPLGPPTQRHAAMPSIVGTYKSSGKILVDSLFPPCEFTLLMHLWMRVPNQNLRWNSLKALELVKENFSKRKKKTKNKTLKTILEYVDSVERTGGKTVFYMY